MAKTKKITKTTFVGSSKIFAGKNRKKAPVYEMAKCGGLNFPVIYMITSLNERRHFLYNLKGRKPTKEEIAIVDRAPNPRCWGWVPTWKEADEAVRGNSGDMAECCYFTHAVVEKVMCGIPNYNTDESSETWYKWHVDPKNNPHRFRGKWKQCPKPGWSKGTVGWSVG